MRGEWRGYGGLGGVDLGRSRGGVPVTGTGEDSCEGANCMIAGKWLVWVEVRGGGGGGVMGGTQVIREVQGNVGVGGNMERRITRGNGRERIM